MDIWVEWELLAKFRKLCVRCITKQISLEYCLDVVWNHDRIKTSDSNMYLMQCSMNHFLFGHAHPLFLSAQLNVASLKNMSSVNVPTWHKCPLYLVGFAFDRQSHKIHHTFTYYQLRMRCLDIFTSDVCISNKFSQFSSTFICSTGLYRTTDRPIDMSSHFGSAER